MQIQSILAVLSLAVAAPAAPAPNSSPAPTCNNGQVLACCDSFKNGTGVGCIFSTLNILNPVCSGSQSLACCNAPQTGLINIECIPISIAL